jgi:hypothetical protein
MHSANFTAARLALADMVGGEPLPGRIFPHACRADWNPGEDGSSPEPGEMLMLPLPPGSGKLVTPWARMHCENSSAGSAPAAVVVAPPDDPQAAIRTAHGIAIITPRETRIPIRSTAHRITAP